MSRHADTIRGVLRGQWAISAARLKALDATEALEDERDDARAENEQLRAALLLIAEHSADDGSRQLAAAVLDGRPIIPPAARVEQHR